MYPSEKKINKFKTHHKESYAKPLNDSEDDDISPISRKPHNIFYKDGYQSEVSRFMDDKRSTIKEQLGEEEEFTGSSINMSVQRNAHKKHKKCKNKKKSRKGKCVVLSRNDIVSYGINQNL